MKTKIFIIIFLLNIIFTISFADTTQFYEIEQGKYSYVNKELENKKIKINNITITIKEAFAELESIDEMVELLQNDIEESENELIYKKNSIDELRSKTQNSTNEVNNIKYNFTAYKNKLLNKEINNSWSLPLHTKKYKLELFKITLSVENSIIAVINREREVTDNKQIKLNLEIKELQDLNKRLNEKKEIIKNKQNEKLNLIEVLNKEKNAYTYIYQNLMYESNEIKEKLKKLEKNYYISNLEYANGILAYPTTKRGTKITSDFGEREQPLEGASTKHPGIDIGGVGYGAPVVAAEAGRVVLATTQVGYGNVILIDHGNGITTTYGHNSKLKVKKGDIVKRGQLIALTGSTGYSTGPHIHFEVRVNGIPQDPKPWLK